MVFGFFDKSFKSLSAGGQEDQLCDVNNSITVMSVLTCLKAFAVPKDTTKANIKDNIKTEKMLRI